MNMSSLCAPSTVLMFFMGTDVFEGTERKTIVHMESPVTPSPLPRPVPPLLRPAPPVLSERDVCIRRLTDAHPGPLLLFDGATQEGFHGFHGVICGQLSAAGG